MACQRLVAARSETALGHLHICVLMPRFALRAPLICGYCTPESSHLDYLSVEDTQGALHLSQDIGLIDPG
eukprot:6203600-Pleurochrysis_carterae.AAC.1